MPIGRNAKKALRVAESKTSRNRYRKDQLKDALKKADSSAFSFIDKAAKWGIIHPNKASRLKSQLAKKIGSTPAKTEKAPKAVTKKATPKAAKPAAKKSAVKKTAKK